MIVTKLSPFPKYSNNVLYVFIDVDGDNDTGYWIPGLGAEFRLEITATSWILNNQTNSFEPVLSGILQVHDASRSRYDLNSFLPLTSFKVVTKDVIEFQLPLFDISSNSNSNIKLFFYMIDDQSNFDTSDWIYGINTPSINFDSSKDIERANHNSYYDSDGEIDIDGSFQDWYSPFSSVERYDDGIDSALNPDIDLRDYATSAYEKESFFYLKVEGEILSGTLVPPNTDSRFAIPSSGSGSNQEPTKLPVMTGDDTIYIYLDLNGDNSYGYSVDGDFSASHMIEFRGINGIILSSYFYNYTGLEGSSTWSWDRLSTVSSASNENELECMIMNLPEDFAVRIYLVSWNGDSDNSDTFNVHIVFSRTSHIPDFSSLLMPIASVLLVVGFNFRKKELN